MYEYWILDTTPTAYIQYAARNPGYTIHSYLLVITMRRTKHALILYKTQSNSQRVILLLKAVIRVLYTYSNQRHTAISWAALR